ncbi:MAG TPA: CehA/McbA family metallohydrolase, partial [Rhodothermales bacterium]
FPATAESNAIEYRFVLDDPARFRTLRWRQEDVRRRWTIRLNDVEVTALAEDEAPLAGLVEIPRGLLRPGENVLRVETGSDDPDDVRIGPIDLLETRVERLLSEARLDVQITDSLGRSMPGRITVVDGSGALVPLQARRSEHIAVRTGVVYTANGLATITLPDGSYRIYVSRGPSWEADNLAIWLPEDERLSLAFRLAESVTPAGFLGVDTHVHTLEWSGHGDASLRDRAITAAGEGLDALVLTEHNRNATMPDAAARPVAGSVRFIPGNEYTTPLGHFNVFPVDANAAAPDPGVTSWVDVAERIGDPTVAILNHGRDLHMGFAPLGPERFVAETAARLDGQTLPTGAMEVWNSSAQRSDPLELFRDWLALAHRGTVLTPIGSSDSHDVSRYLLGPGRTWARCDECDGASADVDRIASAIAHGRVSASMGLVVEIDVNGQSAGGELIAVDDSVDVEARVWGPSWIRADELTLFINGRALETRTVKTPEAAGLKGTYHWRLPVPAFDASVAALATGPAPLVPFWKIPRPYQRTSDVVQPIVAGTSGLVRLDGDGDGSWTSPFAFAESIVSHHRTNLRRLAAELNRYDAIVSLFAAELLDGSGIGLADLAFAGANSEVRAGFARYDAAARDRSVPQMNAITAP